MLDDDFDPELDQAIRTTIMNVMAALYEQGITEVHIGGMMRLLGIDDRVAARHDKERVILNDDFAKYVKQLKEPIPPGQILH